MLSPALTIADTLHGHDTALYMLKMCSKSAVIKPEYSFISAIYEGRGDAVCTE